MDWQTYLREKLPRQLPLTQYIVIIPVMLLATVAVYMMGNSIRQLVAAAMSANVVQAKQKTPEASIERKPLPASELQRYQETLVRLHPSVSIELTADSKGFTVSIPDPRLYNEWLFALYSLQSHGKSVLWDVSRLCLKSCGGGAAIAVVQGYTQSVRFK